MYSKEPSRIFCIIDWVSRVCLTYFTINNANSNNTKNTTKNIKNKIFAMPAVAAEIPVKPNRPAIIDMIKKNKAHFNIRMPQVLCSISILV